MRILEILKEYNTLRHVMKVPQELRSEKSFDSDYCALVKALVPTRQKRSRTEQSLSTTKENTTAAPSPSKPPRKPQRTHRFRRSGSAYGARELAKVCNLKYLTCASVSIEEAIKLVLYPYQYT